MPYGTEYYERVKFVASIAVPGAPSAGIRIELSDMEQELTDGEKLELWESLAAHMDAWPDGGAVSAIRERVGNTPITVTP